MNFLLGLLIFLCGVVVGMLVAKLVLTGTLWGDWAVAVITLEAIVYAPSEENISPIELLHKILKDQVEDHALLLMYLGIKVGKTV